MPKLNYNGAHAGNIVIEGHQFHKGKNEVSSDVLQHPYTKWMLANKHFTLEVEEVVVEQPVVKVSKEAEVASKTPEVLLDSKEVTKTAVKVKKTAEIK